MSKTFSDNDLILITKDPPDSDNMRQHLHALGFVEAHEGEQSLKVKFLLTDVSQLGNAAGTQRVQQVRSVACSLLRLNSSNPVQLLPLRGYPTCCHPRCQEACYAAHLVQNLLMSLPAGSTRCHAGPHMPTIVFTWAASNDHQQCPSSNNQI